VAERSATTLERAIARAQAGDVDSGVPLWAFAASDVVFLNNSEPQEGEFPSDPMVLLRGEQQFLAAFSHGDLISSEYLQNRSPVVISALELLRRVPPTAGLTVNPGTRLGFEVPAEGLRLFVADLLGTTVSP
jgi:hypothetical protein